MLDPAQGEVLDVVGYKGMLAGLGRQRDDFITCKI